MTKFEQVLIRMIGVVVKVFGSRSREAFVLRAALTSYRESEMREVMYH
jgi:hypothetical protein